MKSNCHSKDNIVGSNVTHLRTVANLTCEDVAKLLNLPVDIYIACERGETSFSASRVFSLAKYFRVPVFSLFENRCEDAI